MIFPGGGPGHDVMSSNGNENGKKKIEKVGQQGWTMMVGPLYDVLTKY